MVIRERKLTVNKKSWNEREGNLEWKVHLGVSRATFLERNSKLLLLQDQVYLEVSLHG